MRKYRFPMIPLCVAILVTAEGRSVAQSIHASVRAGDLARISALVKEDPSVLRAVEWGRTPLQEAAWGNAKETADFLISKGAKLEILSAAGLGLKERVAKFLKDAPAAVRAEDGGGRTALIYAIVNGHHDIVRLLLANGTDVNGKEADALAPNSPLEYALDVDDVAMVNFLLAHKADAKRQGLMTFACCRTSNLEILEALRKHGADVNGASDIGFPLSAAVAGKRPASMVEYLLGHGAKVDAKSEGYERTALHDAAAEGNAAAIKVLLKYKATVNVKDVGYGFTPLHWAAYGGHKDVAALLRDHEADPNLEATFGKNALDVAAEQDHREVAKLLASRGATVNFFAALYLGDNDRVKQLVKAKPSLARDQIVRFFEYNYPIIWAAHFNNKDLIALFLANGADINVSDAHNRRHRGCLLEAVRRQDKALVEFLLDHKADASPGWGFDLNERPVRFHLGMSPLDEAAGLGSIPIVELLLKHKADLKNDHPVVNATWADQPEMVEFLLDRGADVNGPCPDYTPLHIAAEKNYKKIAALLLGKGAKVNLGGQARTPLWLAVRSNHTSVAELLLANKASANGADESGSTLLHYAARAGNAELVQLLIRSKADVNARDGKLYTPLDIALLNKHKEVAAILRKNGGVK